MISVALQATGLIGGVAGAVLVAGRSPRQRAAGFTAWILGNGAWVGYAALTGSLALGTLAQGAVWADEGECGPDRLSRPRHAVLNIYSPRRGRPDEQSGDGRCGIGPALCWITTTSSPGPSARPTTIPATSTTAAPGPPTGGPGGAPPAAPEYTPGCGRHGSDTTHTYPGGVPHLPGHHRPPVPLPIPGARSGCLAERTEGENCRRYPAGRGGGTETYGVSVQPFTFGRGKIGDGKNLVSGVQTG